MSVSNILTRIRNDYFMPSRLNEYEELVIAAKDAGYRQLSVRDVWSEMKVNNNLRKRLVHRHDVDTDVATAKKMFDIECRHGVKSTFYFRLSTLDIDFMREIEGYGSEASYHYEELATYAKRNHIKDPEIVVSQIKLIRDEFISNLEWIRQRSRLPLKTVASHGDFANRRLGLINYLILEDESFRKKCEIDLESYDHEFMNGFNYRISDKPYPLIWDTESPLKIIQEGVCNIFLLTHPRQWHSNIVDNTCENLKRIYEDFRW